MMHVAAAKLLQDPSTTPEQAAQFWESFAVPLPDAAGAADFLIGFATAAERTFREHQAELRRLAEEKRQADAEYAAKFNGKRIP